MKWIKLNPLTAKKAQKSRSIKRGYISFILFTFLVVLSLGAELFINSRALIVKYEGEFYFPTYGEIIPGSTFGLSYNYETNYRELRTQFKEEDSGNWVLMPPVPYNAFESDYIDGKYPPYAPSAERQHYLGTDVAGRDVLARLFYGFRIAIFFSLALLVCSYLIGISIGCLMGYLGGRFDLFFQRIIEIWSNIPYLYTIIIVASIIAPTFGILVAIMVFFGWMSMTWYMRTSTYKERAREYVMAAKALGANHRRIIFHHIIPNAISVIVTFIPFTIVSGITSLTALDYLGYGLPKPTPSWGELLKEGTAQLDSLWIVMSVIVAMVVVLTMVTFIGEAIREAFDPKKFSYYE